MEWLPKNWEQQVHTQILSTSLDPTKITFAAWSAQILLHNMCLQNYPTHMDDKALRRQMEAMFDEELRILIGESSVAEITSLRSWIAKVKEIDARRQLDLK
jgi:hypothetical protein